MKKTRVYIVVKQDKWTDKVEKVFHSSAAAAEYARQLAEISGYATFVSEFIVE